MDDKATQDFKESDSQSPSDNEKHTGQSPIDLINQEVPDPDAHLSEEERKKIVRYRCCAFRDRLTLQQDRKLLWKLDIQLIPWVTLLYLVSFLGEHFEALHLRGLLTDFRSNQYRQCQNRRPSGGLELEQWTV